MKLKICHYHKYLKTAWRWTSGTQCPQRLWRRRLHESKHRTQADITVTILTDEWQMPILDSDQTHRQTERLDKLTWQIVTRHIDWLTMTDNTTATNNSSHFCNVVSCWQGWADTLQDQQKCMHISSKIIYKHNNYCIPNTRHLHNTNTGTQKDTYCNRDGGWGGGGGCKMKRQNLKAPLVVLTDHGQGDKQTMTDHDQTHTPTWKRQTSNDR